MHMTDTINTKRLVLLVPDEFHHKLKVAAAQKRKDMRDVVVECVTACLETVPADVERLAQGLAASCLSQPRKEG